MVVTLPAPVVEQIEEAAKERGETVAGWCRATIIEAAAVERPYEAIERWLRRGLVAPVPRCGDAPPRGRAGPGPVKR